MEYAAPVFYDDVEAWVGRVLLVFALAVEAFAFVNCLIQRSESFAAIGTLSKNLWLGLIGGALLLTVLSSAASPSIFGFIGITVGAIYLLDVRPALRDAVDGSGPW